MLETIYKIGYLLEIKKRIARIKLEKIFIEQGNVEALKRDLEKMEKEMDELKNIKNKTDKLKNKQIKLFREIEETKNAKKDFELAERKLKELRLLLATIKQNLWR